jgi:transcription initiation factor IIE alpha subunit
MREGEKRRMNNRVKNSVLKYVVEHPGASDDEIAEALKLHIVDVTAALVLLKKEGKIKEAA